MVKKTVTVFLFYCLFTGAAGAGEKLSTKYPVHVPTTEIQIKQIKWCYNDGYFKGILSSYGWFMGPPMPTNFTLPITKTAWELGYIKGILEINEDGK